MQNLTHTPYDGTATPFTIGLKPLDEAQWLEVDQHLGDHLKLKQRLLHQQYDEVVSVLPEASNACEELLNLVSENLSRFHQQTHQQEGFIWRLPTLNRSVDISAMEPLVALGHLMQEDFCILRKKPDGHYLVAALLCFPSSWRLADKIGRKLEMVHAPVPDYQGPMAERVNLLFDRLRPDQIVWRLNWSIDEGADLFRPSPHSHDLWVTAGDDPLNHLYIRVERQTLRRLPIAGDIIFTIRIHTNKLVDLVSTPESAQLLSGLIKQLENFTDAQCAYKGLTKARPVIISRLREFI